MWDIGRLVLAYRLVVERRLRLWQGGLVCVVVCGQPERNFVRYFQSPVLERKDVPGQNGLGLCVANPCGSLNCVSDICIRTAGWIDLNILTVVRDLLIVLDTLQMEFSDMVGDAAKSSDAHHCDKGLSKRCRGWLSIVKGPTWCSQKFGVVVKCGWHRSQP